MLTGNKKAEKTLMVCLWAWIVLATIPFLRAASLATFNTDDFGIANRFISGNGSPIKVAIERMIEGYRTWQGTYAATFLVNLTNPVNWYSYRLLRLELIALICMSVAGLYLCIKTILKHWKSDIPPVYIVALILLQVFWYREYYEIYTWYVGAMLYLLPMIALEFGIVFLLNGIDSKKNGFFPCALLCFALMCGCNIEVTGFCMTILLVVSVLDWISSGKLKKSMGAAFLFALACAFINALAPGNFVRRGSLGNSLHVVRGAYLSFKLFFEDSLWMHSHGTFLICEFLAFLTGIKLTRGIGKKAAVALVIGLLALPVITIFPFVIGYGFSDYSIENGCPNRALFPLEVAVILCFIGLSVVVGCEMKTLKKFDPKVLICPFLFIVLLVSFINKSPKSISSEIVKNLRNGTIMENTYYYRKMYDGIKDSEEPDVIVPFLPKHVIGSTTVELAEVPGDYWINEEIAMYFGKRSVLYNPDPEKYSWEDYISEFAGENSGIIVPKE